MDRLDQKLISIKLQPSALVRTRTDIKLQPIDDCYLELGCQSRLVTVKRIKSVIGHFCLGQS